jgi:hypothetical protein
MNNAWADSSDKTIAVANEQLFPQYGFSISIAQVNHPGPVGSNPNPDPNNGFITASMTFTDPTKQWLTGLKDAEGYSRSNWIRSGTVSNSGDCTNSYNDFLLQDNDGIYEKVINGTWAPYRLCASRYTGSTSPLSSCYYGGPAASNPPVINSSQMSSLQSIDVVLTIDKSKWTRCVVLELCEDATISEGNSVKLDPRRSPSRDKQGKQSGDSGYNAGEGDLVSTQGMSWFPGYAINLETGERLNMAFGENSSLIADNGRDMKWNPTGNTYSIPASTPIFGGQHYIYVFAHTYNPSNNTDRIPRYDNSQVIWTMLNNTVGDASVLSKRDVFAAGMWVNIPLLKSGYSASSLPESLPTDVKIRLRVAKPYVKGYSTPNDTSSTPQNNNLPMYTFNTSDLKTVTNDANAAKDALELINVVPNPYYAFSAYETSRLDNRVKVTNLPEKCTISIYTVSGTLVRKFKKDDPKTSLDWDLKNQNGIPLASGLYIIHVDVPDVGEKILKFFGVMRQVDLDSF